MGRVNVAALVSITACSFAPNGGAPRDGGGDGATSDADGGGLPIDAMIDAAPGTAVVSFGERTGATHHGVTTDTYLESANMTTNHGSDPGIWADASPVTNGLIRFDVSALAPGTAVVGARLTLVTTTDSLESGTVQAYPVLEAWQQANANWPDRDTAVPWTGAGATAGSRGGTLVGEITPSVDNTAYVMTLDTATVQTWVNDPAANNGLVLISTSTTGNGVTFSSSDEPTATLRPLLQIAYTP